MTPSSCIILVCLIVLKKLGVSCQLDGIGHCWYQTFHRLASPPKKKRKRRIRRKLYILWHVTDDRWHVTRYKWHMTCDMWHGTCDKWRELDILPKFQVSSYIWNVKVQGWKCVFYCLQTLWQGKYGSPWRNNE